MATKKKLLEAAAGAAGGAALNVENVFSTYLYTGNNSTQTITNGIDLAGEGGMVWLKARSTTSHNHIADTERGGNKWIYSNLTSAQDTVAYIPSFNSDGFSMSANGATNANGTDYASWTFRKAPKFFDVVTYTGDGTTGREISHGLDHTVGSVIIKRTDTTGDWWLWHRSATTYSPSNLKLNSTAAEQGGAGKIESVSSTTFTIGSANDVNASGGTYVAYLFAHNDGDGEFGPTGDQDIIKCGSFTTSAYPLEVNLGWEPSYILTKRTDDIGSWWVWDTMRGIATGGNDSYLFPNLSNAENSAGVVNNIDVTATGFNIVGTGAFPSNGTYIYIAIRRGPMAVPTDATDVFDVTTYTGNSSNPRKITTTLSHTDLVLAKVGYNQFVDETVVYDRLRGNGISLETPTTDTEAVPSGSGYDVMFDTNDGFLVGNPWNAYLNYSTYNVAAWSWKRAPSFFDVVAYTGTGVNGTSVSHNLAYSPEMIWVKRRDSTADWFVYHTGLTSNYYLSLNSTAAETFGVRINTPTSTTFNVGSNLGVNASGGTYIAYLFASLDGISKVGSFTTTGGAVNVDCGFSSGARFVLLKAASGTNANLYNWELYDTARGIVAGNDSVLFLNDTSAEYTGGDYIDPYSAGFTFNSGAGGRPSGQTIIFYAIA